MIDANRWRGRPVLVTGHTGFKGGWLSLWLAEMGAEVSGFSLPAPTDPSLFEVARVGERVRSTIGDVRDAAALTAAVSGCEPEVIFHLAAQPLVRYGYQNPRETYETNVMGTVNLLDAVRNVPAVRAVVVVTSDKCYDNDGRRVGYREEDPMGGHDPYSSSKGCTELVTAAYRTSYFAGDGAAGVASARAGNVIGGGDWSGDRLLPDMVRATRASQPTQIRFPNAVRPWQHVLDPLAGYLMLAERLAAGDDRFAGAWNFGPDEGSARTVGDVLRRFTARWPGSRWQASGDAHPYEAAFLQVDSAKARRELGWRPRVGFDAAVDRTVDWYRENAAGRDMQEATLAEIRDYMSGADRPSAGAETRGA